MTSVGAQLATLDLRSIPRTSQRMLKYKPGEPCLCAEWATWSAEVNKL